MRWIGSPAAMPPRSWLAKNAGLGVLERRLDVPQPVLAAEAAANVPAVDVARRTAQRHGPKFGISVTFCAYHDVLGIIPLGSTWWEDASAFAAFHQDSQEPGGLGPHGSCHNTSGRNGRTTCDIMTHSDGDEHVWLQRPPR